MALRVLRASSSSLARHSQRPLSTSSPRYLLFDNNPHHNTDSDGPPPTSSDYSRTTTTTNNNYNKNPFRLNLSQHAIVQNYRIHVSCTPNNTHIVMSNPHGRLIKGGNWTGGSVGFRGVNRSLYEAGYQCAVRAFARAKELVEQAGPGGGVRFEVLLKGFGQGREAVVKALMTSEGDDVRPYIIRVTDNTPIKIGGTRAKKMRRL
jgi:small subunit ribosomal protein S11